MQPNTLVNLQDEQVDDPYLIGREMLAEIVGAEAIAHYGGVENIASSLRTDLDAGIAGDATDVQIRREAFGRNTASQPPPQPAIKRVRHLLSHACRDTTILLLLGCAILSLAIGIKTDGAAEAVADAALFLLAASLAVSFAAAARFLRGRWAAKKRNDDVCVVRNGVVRSIPGTELVVGDIVVLKSGDRIPADGIFITGDDSFQLNADHPSLFTGGEVVGGGCRMLVTSVGDNTEKLRLMRSVGVAGNDRLQLLDAIEKMCSKFDKVWLSLSLVVLVLQFVRCFVAAEKARDRNFDPKGMKNRMEDLMKEVVKKERLKEKNGLVTMLCVLIFASREGLPLALFVSLLYASHRIKTSNAIAGQLQASATVGLITTICTCKTSDLALQHAKMADLWIGFDLVPHHHHHVVDARILEALRYVISLEEKEISLLAWAGAVLGGLHIISRDSPLMVRYEMDEDLFCSILRSQAVDDDDKVVVHVHWRGSPDSILSMCSHYYTIDGEIETLDSFKTTAFTRIVAGFGKCCFAFAYKRQIHDEEEEEEEEEDIQSDLILLGLVCLKNPYSAEVIHAIEDCRRSGVEIKLVVDDDITTARIMALSSGLVKRGEDDSDGGAIVDAADFRSSSEADRLRAVDGIQVMANASPADKMLMVRCLRQKRRRVVAAAAAGVRDSAMLREADVGISMGTAHKEDADIVIPGGEFSQIPAVMNLGKRACRSLEKFVQLQLTMEISAFTINIVSLVATSKEALSLFQLLFINLIMEILGAAAVAITTMDGGGSSNPVYGSGRIITRAMCVSIAVQSSFQVGVMLAMLIKGRAVFEVKESAVGAMILNCYAFFQVFLLIPAVGRSWVSLGIVGIIGIVEVAVVEIVGVVARRPRLGIKLWGICIGISSLSLPLTCVTNWIIRISQL